MIAAEITESTKLCLILLILDKALLKKAFIVVDTAHEMLNAIEPIIM
jgi:hypothetical protein